MKKTVVAVILIALTLSSILFLGRSTKSQDEWEIKLDKPLECVRQEVAFAFMPEVVWDAFSLPEFQREEDRFPPLIRPGARPTHGSSFYGYGMGSDRHLAKAVLEANGIKPGYGGVGVGAGQYAHYQRVEIADYSLYDPRQHAFLISYMDDYLEITFPDLQTMRVRRLKPPKGL